MNLAKLFSPDSLIAALLENLIESGSARAFIVPAAVVAQICAKFGVRSTDNVARVVQAFRDLGAAMGNVVAAVIGSRG